MRPCARCMSTSFCSCSYLIGGSGFFFRFSAYLFHRSVRWPVFGFVRLKHGRPAVVGIFETFPSATQMQICAECGLGCWVEGGYRGKQYSFLTLRMCQTESPGIRSVFKLHVWAVWLIDLFMLFLSMSTTQLLLNPRLYRHYRLQSINVVRPQLWTRFSAIAAII